MSQLIDDIYKNSLDEVAGFRFDEPVVKVFKDMISRSVPGYNLILNLLGIISAKYAQDNSNCYDLGCSLGASTLAMRHNINASNCQLIGIDNSSAMIEQCKKNIQQDNSSTPVEVILADIFDHEFNNASISVLNFTLQFIAVDQRLPLLKRIADATLENGVLLLSEKIQIEDARHDSEIIDLHHQFKKHNGYSDLEISQKRESLENVLIPETLTAHKARLLEAGFSQVFVCLQCFNFASLIAIK